jgi:uncharacterized protein YbjT (DUF2867 family)
VSSYSLLVSLHVACVIVWLGSSTTVAFLTVYALRANRIVLGQLGALVRALTLWVLLPASLAAPAVGVAAAHAGHWPELFFFHVGEGAFAFSFLLTVAVRLPLLRRGRRGTVDDVRLARYLLALAVAELTVLYVAVADMVVKPDGIGAGGVRYGAGLIAVGLLAAVAIAFRGHRTAARTRQKENGMRIVVIGGTGLIGSKLVEKLRAAGHDPLAASLDTGVNTITGEGLREALAGAEVVVDVSNSPALDDAGVLSFFQTSSRNLLAAESEVGVKHHVVLSVVGADRLPESGYLRAKVAQEDVVKESSVPYTILRASQFFEFIGRLADSSSDGTVIHLAPAFIQPESADDVAAALADVAVHEPANGIVELGGPEEFRLDELARRVLDAINDERLVETDAHALYFGAELEPRSLVPGPHARIAATRFEDWLDRSTAA